MGIPLTYTEFRHLPKSRVKKFKAIAQEIEEQKFKMAEQVGPLALLLQLI